jgi:hypothetical protein
VVSIPVLNWNLCLFQAKVHQFVAERYPEGEREAHAQRLITILKNLRRRRTAEMHRR